MKNESLINASKKLLLNLLVQCTDGQKLMFNRLYCHEKLDATPEEAVEQMDASNIDWAISQIERSLAKNNNYEKIKLACQKANPKLMELSFGCEIEVAGHYACPCSIETVLHQSDEKVVLYGRTNPLPKVKISKILGHEPTIQDIFLAISEKLKAEDMYYTFTIEVCDILELYDLTKPVKDQSEKTLQLIADLL